MSNELSIMEKGTVVNDFSTIRNIRLRQATQKIYRLTNSAKKTMFEIATILLKINSEKLFEEDGFANIYEYGEQVLGYKRAMTNNLIRIAFYYIDKESMKSILATETGDYSASQLQELLVIEPKEALQMSHDELINPDMKIREIREAVKKFRDKDKTQDEEATYPDEEAGHTIPEIDKEAEYNEAYEEFHRTYMKLKDCLTAPEIDVKRATDVLMPDLMQSMILMHERR